MKQFSLVIVSLLALMLLPLQASGENLEYYGVENHIMPDFTVVHKTTFIFKESITKFSFPVPSQPVIKSVNSSFDFAECEPGQVQGNPIISCSMIGVTPDKNRLTVEYETKGEVRRIEDFYRYTVDLSLEDDVESSFILIRIPQNSILVEGNESFFPTNGKILSDGRYIMVYWSREGEDSGQNLAHSVSFSLPLIPGFLNFTIISLTLLVVSAMIGVAVYIKRGQRARKPLDVVKSVLNRDEKRIVDILYKNKGKVGQKVLVRETDFSKAKVSRIVNSLKERGILETEPISGRENRVILRIEKKAEETKEG